MYRVVHNIFQEARAKCSELFCMETAVTLVTHLCVLVNNSVEAACFLILLRQNQLLVFHDRVCQCRVFARLKKMAFLYQHFA